MADQPKKVIPRPTPETEHFWQGTKVGELRLQQCSDCAHVYFPPRPFCPECSSRNIRITQASGKATLYSYVISHRTRPPYENPLSIAVVQLEEGPRMMCNIVETEQTPEALVLDMALEVTYEQLSDDIFLPQFKPAEA